MRPASVLDFCAFICSSVTFALTTSAPGMFSKRPKTSEGKIKPAMEKKGSAIVVLMEWRTSKKPSERIVHTCDLGLVKSMDHVAVFNRTLPNVTGTSHADLK